MSGEKLLDLSLFFAGNVFILFNEDGAETRKACQNEAFGEVFLKNQQNNLGSFVYIDSCHE